MLPKIYDACEELYLRKGLQRVNKRAHLIKINERDDDNIENCVKFPHFNIVIKHVYKCLAPNCVI